MINPHLVTVDWDAISTESLVLAPQFKENELSLSISNEISFEDGMGSKIYAFVKKLITSIIGFIGDKAKMLGSLMTSQRYKTIGNRANAFSQYMKVKISPIAKADTHRQVKNLLANDSEYKGSFERALDNLNQYLATPYESIEAFYMEVEHQQQPYALAHFISKRAKLQQVLSVEKTTQLLNAIKKLMQDSATYKWDNFAIGDTKFPHVDEIRFILDNQSLFQDSREEFDKTAELVRDILTGKNPTLSDNVSIYDIDKNYGYVMTVAKQMPECINILTAASKNLKNIEREFNGHFGKSEDEFNKDTAERIRACVSMFGALSGYVGSLGRFINQIDGYNSALMTVMKYVNPEYVLKHIKDRGVVGAGSSELDTQAYSLLMNDKDVIEMALEHFELYDVKDEMQRISDNYVAAIAIEARVNAYGACIKDAAALESLSPNCFKGQQITDMFDFRPSMRNAEVALEITSILKSALFTVLVTLVIKYMNQIIEFIETKLSRQRIERAIKTMAKFKITITKKVPAGSSYSQGNQNVMAGLQKMRNVDKTGATNPSGASHNSAVKATPNTAATVNPARDDHPSVKRDLYKNVLVPMFGIDDNVGAGLASCTDVRDFLRFLNSANVKGPAIFSNNPIENSRRLVMLANTSIVQLHNIAQGMDSIKKQLDGFIAGTSNRPYFITEATGPLKQFLNDNGDDNLGRVAKDTRDALNVWMRKTSLVGSPLLRDPKVIEDTFNMLITFKNEEATSRLNKFSKDIKGVSQSAQMSLDKFMAAEGDSERKQEIVTAVKKYVAELRELAEVLGSMVQLISRSVSYIESLANAANMFIEG